jgi:hypothetical protein
MRLIVAGSRTVTERRIVWDGLDRLFPNSAPTVVVSGLAKGPDTFGLWWAVHHGIRVDEHEALWDIEGRSAGYKRNVRMAKVADALAAFYDGVSRGTRHMIDIARETGLTIRIVT